MKRILLVWFLSIQFVCNSQTKKMVRMDINANFGDTLKVFQDEIEVFNKYVKTEDAISYTGQFILIKKKNKSMLKVIYKNETFNFYFKKFKLCYQIDYFKNKINITPKECSSLYE